MEKSKKRKSEADTGKGKRTKASATDKSGYAKRPMSAFFVFSQSLREDLKKNGTSTGGVESLAKMAGLKWKEMSEAEKKPYVEKAKKDKERYEKELASGLTAPPRKNKSKRKVEKVKDPNRPKRANSAYLFFSADFRKSPEASGIKHTDMMKAAASKWKSMPDSDKKPYLEMEKADKARFQKEMESYGSKPKKAVKSDKRGKPVPASKHSDDSISDNESIDDDDDDMESDEDE